MKEINKKTIWKIAIITLALILVVVIATIAWIEAYWICIDEIVFYNLDPMVLDLVRVLINQAYVNQFKAEEITIEDFDWSNIERIEYFVYNSVEMPASQYGINVYLIKPGEREVKKALMHFCQLDFVEYAMFGESWFAF